MIVGTSGSATPTAEAKTVEVEPAAEAEAPADAEAAAAIGFATTGFNRAEISAIVHRLFGSFRKLWVAISKNSCGTESFTTSCPCSFCSGACCVSDSTSVTPTDQTSPAGKLVP